MRALSLRQANMCDNAQHPKCRCRCHGAAHGAKRGGLPTAVDSDTIFFQTLPEDDPHHCPEKPVKIKRKPPLPGYEDLMRWRRRAKAG